MSWHGFVDGLTTVVVCADGHHLGADPRLLRGHQPLLSRAHRAGQHRLPGAAPASRGRGRDLRWCAHAGCLAPRARLQRGDGHRHLGAGAALVALPAARGGRRGRRQLRRDLRAAALGLRPGAHPTGGPAGRPHPGPGHRRARAAGRADQAGPRAQGELRPVRGDQRRPQRGHRATHRDRRRRLHPRTRRTAAGDPAVRRRPDPDGGRRGRHPAGQRQPGGVRSHREGPDAQALAGPDPGGRVPPRLPARPDRVVAVRSPDPDQRRVRPVPTRRRRRGRWARPRQHR